MHCQLFQLRDYETEIGVCFNFAVKFPIRPPPGKKPRCSESEMILLPAHGKSKLEIDGTEKALKTDQKTRP